MDQGLKNLVEEALGLFAGQGLATLSAHVLLEVKFEVFKDEVELVLAVDDFFESKGR